MSYIGKLTFVFLLALMFLASHESECNADVLNYSWVLLSAFLWMVLCIVTIVYKGSHYWGGYWNFIWGGIGIWVLAGLSFSEWPTWIINKSFVVYLIFCFLLLLTGATVVIFEYEEGRSKSICLQLTALRNILDPYMAWCVNPNNIILYETLPRTIKKLLNQNASFPIAQDAVNGYVKSQIHKMCEDHQTLRYCLISPMKSFELKICQFFEWHRLTWKTLIVSLLLVIYCWGIVKLLFTY